MRTRKQCKSGFTVIELMVSLCVGGIAISSLYAVGAASTRHFREQQRISTTQSSLRSAMNQLKRDFARAGYLTTPNASLAGEYCGPKVSAPVNDETSGLGRGRLAGISAFHKTVTIPTQLDPDNLNSTLAQVDDVILMGNYATSGEYMDITMATDELSASVPTTTESFTRDFTYWYQANGSAAGTCSNPALQAAFPKGRLVRVRNLQNLNGFAQVSQAVCNAGTPTATISFQPAIRNCNATSGWIAPVNTIRYHAENAAGTEISRIGGNRIAVLRRTEMDPSDKTKPLTVTDGTGTRNVDDRAVLDYLVRFRVDFLLRDSTSANKPTTVPATELDVNAKPEWVRSAIVELAARTAEHEPDMDVSLNTARLPPFRVLKTQGAARTRALRAEIFIPNIAYARY
jgi:prepilin-type N-terminal cleavage/methylation domain-containing protein